MSTTNRFISPSHGEMGRENPFSVSGSVVLSLKTAVKTGVFAVAVLLHDLLPDLPPHVLEPALLAEVRGTYTDRAGSLVPVQDQALEDHDVIPDPVHVRHGPPEEVDQLHIVGLVHGHLVFQGWVEPRYIGILS